MKSIAILFLLFVPAFVFGQGDHRISRQEILQMPAYLDKITQRNIQGFVHPPASPVRTAAEWEEIDALMITWASHFSILSQIADAAQEEVEVIIVCDDSIQVKNYLSTAGVPLTNIKYLVVPFNTIWCRDYGQWNAYSNDVDSLFIIDWIYNRPRPDDDMVPVSIANYSGLPLYQTTTAPFNLIHTGGNFMTDGLGTGFSSELIIDENPGKTEAEIDSTMMLFMGIDRYIKMETLPWDQIHHIDMHIKLLDEETLLVGEYPAGVADGPQIEANLQYILSNFNSVFGTPYKVIRVPMPPDGFNIYPNQGGDYRTYTNSVFVNNTVIVPFYDVQYDTIAERIYKEALPGYNIQGINCNNIIPSLGAIHCITKEVAAKDPLLISHKPLGDTFDSATPFNVNARIQHRSGISQASVYFRTDTLQTWQHVTMNNTNGYTWSGIIPAHPAGTTIHYYVEAQSNSGKTQVRPMPAPQGYWKFEIQLNTGLTEEEKYFFMVENIFPNPSRGITCIPVKSPHNIRLSINLQNVIGEKVLGVYEGNHEGDQKYFMNTSILSPGVYILKFETGKRSFSKKLIVK